MATLRSKSPLDSSIRLGTLLLIRSIHQNWRFFTSRNASVKAFDPEVTPCSSAPPGAFAKLGACSCTDCEGSCQVPDFGSDECGIGCYTEYYRALIYVAFIAGSLVFLVALKVRANSQVSHLFMNVGLYFNIHFQVHPINENVGVEEESEWYNRTIFNIHEKQRAVFERSELRHENFLPSIIHILLPSS